MTSLRPGGKVLKIAKATVPGMANGMDKAPKPMKPTPDYDQIVKSINENGGKLLPEMRRQPPLDPSVVTDIGM